MAADVTEESMRQPSSRPEATEEAAADATGAVVGPLAGRGAAAARQQTVAAAPVTDVAPVAETTDGAGSAPVAPVEGGAAPVVNTWRGQVSIEIPVRREDDSSRVYVTVSEIEGTTELYLRRPVMYEPEKISRFDVIVCQASAISALVFFVGASLSLACRRPRRHWRLEGKEEGEEEEVDERGEEENDDEGEERGEEEEEEEGEEGEEEGERGEVERWDQGEVVAEEEAEEEKGEEEEEEGEEGEGEGGEEEEEEGEEGEGGEEGEEEEGEEVPEGEEWGQEREEIRVEDEEEDVVVEDEEDKEEETKEEEGKCGGEVDALHVMPVVETPPVEEGSQVGRTPLVSAQSAQGKSFELSSQVQSSREEQGEVRPPLVQVIHQIFFSAPDQDVLLGEGGFLQFFQDTFPGSSIVDESEGTVQSFGHGSGRTPESARACLEHALWVCREGGHKPSNFLLLRFNLVKARDGVDVKLDDMDLSGVSFVRSLTSVAGDFACVGHYVDQCLLFLAGPSRRPPAARSPPDRRFTPPLFLPRTRARVVQLWGLRHCVLAAREQLERKVSQRIRHTLHLNADAVLLTANAFEREGIHFPAVTYDSHGGQLRVEGPEATKDTFEELLCCLNSSLSFFGMVSVDSPILMRILASNPAIERCVAAAGVVGEVHVIASWIPSRLLVWSTDSTGSDDVGKVCKVLTDEVASWWSHEVGVSASKLVYHLPHARRPGYSASEDGIATTWPVELAKLSDAVGMALWVDGVHIRGRVASGALSAQNALQEAVVALSLAHGREAPEFGGKAVPATSAPDRCQPEPPRLCDVVHQCDDVGCGGIVSTPPRPETLEGPAPVPGTRQQPLSIRKQVRQQSLDAAHQESALMMAREPYQGTPDVGFGETVDGSAPVSGVRRQPFPNQEQVRSPQEPTEQPLYAAHQESALMMARESYQGPPGAGFAGTVGGPAPVSYMCQQLFPNQEQVRSTQEPIEQPLYAAHQESALMMARESYQGPPGAGFAGTVDGPAPVSYMCQHLFPNQEQVRSPQEPTEQPLYAAHQESALMMAREPYQWTPGAGFAGTVGGPAPHQQHPGQQQVWLPQGANQVRNVVQQAQVMAPAPLPVLPVAGFSWTVGGPVPEFGMMHQPDPHQGPGTGAALTGAIPTATRGASATTDAGSRGVPGPPRCRICWDCGRSPSDAWYDAPS